MAIPLPDPSAPAAAVINHLLAQEAWARAALVPHAGKIACIDAGATALHLRVGADGLLVADAGVAAVTIRLKLADLPLILQNRERAFSYVKVEGDAEFANAISAVAQGLRWEAEHDLEPWLGPLLATRVVAGARGAVETAKQTQQKLAENLAEYFLEEQPLLVRPAAVDGYGGEIARLRDDVERMDKRIAALERKLAAS
ncbi:SCP2 domain-containing protein [Massilia sp. TS11]|uniref:ubiquinone biosynthesis accessory factor UbiJ n=1 Tax=Massilia sp. TS11 TaxID=2908003 RepID=UPI001EDB8822|nr:SCP2 sterol-binding domain-containing protein [Massilia sp. TS11]MCG2584980.1 SCP2 sterol-binding domain-containing protein [Massilia sp. TS11]